MNNSSTRCGSQAKTDLAIFGALIAAPTLLGLSRGLRMLATTIAVGKFAHSMLSNAQQLRRHEEFSHPNPPPRPQQHRRSQPAPAPQPPHHAPAKGGLDHIEGAASGPMEGAAIIR